MSRGISNMAPSEGEQGENIDIKTFINHMYLPGKSLWINPQIKVCLDSKKRNL